MRPKTLLGTGPLKRAQDLNADYLLKLEPDRMMAYYRGDLRFKARADYYRPRDEQGTG